MPENKSVAFDLSALGDTLEQQINAVSSEKPFLENLTKATLKEFALNRQLDIRENREKENNIVKKFYAITLRLKVEYEHEVDGETQTYVSYDNYGGLRAYPKVDEHNEPIMDENGNPVIERFWAGNPDSNCASYFSLLLQTAQDYDPTIKTYQDFFKFLGEERQCLIKSEKTSFGGRKETIKQVIKEFI